nr:MAG TPA: Spore germination protein GerPC [Microviridae sp.]
MIILMLYLIINCNSTSNYNLDVSGVKLDAFGKRANYIDSIDNRINDRIDYYMQESESEIKEEINNGEVKKMENGIQEFVTALTSAIAGIYCLVKTIMNIVKKLKK